MLSSLVVVQFDFIFYLLFFLFFSLHIARTAKVRHNATQRYHGDHEDAFYIFLFMLLHFSALPSYVCVLRDDYYIFHHVELHRRRLFCWIFDFTPCQHALLLINALGNQ